MAGESYVGGFLQLAGLLQFLGQSPSTVSPGSIAVSVERCERESELQPDIIPANSNGALRLLTAAARLDLVFDLVETDADPVDPGRHPVYHE